MRSNLSSLLGARQNVASWLAALAFLLFGGFCTAARLAPPVNDDLSNASWVDGDTFRLAADLGAATSEPFEINVPCAMGTTAWWKWTAPVAGIYNWDTSLSSNAVVVGVFQFDVFSGLVPVAASGSRPIPATNYLIQANPTGSFQTEEGQEYLIQLDGAFAAHVPNSPPGQFPRTVTPRGGPESYLVQVDFQRVTAVPPANDAFTSRSILSGLEATFSADLTAATGEPSEPGGLGLLHRTLWWSWQAPGYGTATILYLQTNEPPAVSIFARGALESLELQASSAREIGALCDGSVSYSYTIARTNAGWDTKPGAQYEIQVDRYPGLPATGPFELKLVFTPAPMNDIPAGATLLDGTNVSTNASTFGATAEPVEPPAANSLGSKSVWYRWNAPSQGVLRLSRYGLRSFDDPQFDVPVQPGSGGLPPIVRPPPPPSPLGCTDLQDLHPLPDFAPGYVLFEAFPESTEANPSLGVAGTIGTNGLIAQITGPGTYYIDFFGVANTTGAAPLNLLFEPPPTNDNFASRILLPSTPLAVVGRTFAATSEDLDPVHGPSPVPGLDGSARTVWWEWHAPFAGTWTIAADTRPDNYDLFIFRGSAPGRTNIAAHNPATPGLGPAVPFESQAGEIFIIGAFSHSEFGGFVRFWLAPLETVGASISLVPADPISGRAGFQLQPVDSFGIGYVVERSADLANWLPILTNRPGAAPVQIYPESGQDRGFFRIRLWP